MLYFSISGHHVRTIRNFLRSRLTMPRAIYFGQSSMTAPTMSIARCLAQLRRRSSFWVRWPAGRSVRGHCCSRRTQTNRLSGKNVLFGGTVVPILIYATTRLIIPEDQSVLEAADRPVFKAKKKTLLQNFAIFPHLHPSCEEPMFVPSPCYWAFSGHDLDR
jgi:hypothetical protein